MEYHEAGSDAVGGRAWKGLVGRCPRAPTPPFAGAGRKKQWAGQKQWMQKEAPGSPYPGPVT